MLVITLKAARVNAGMTIKEACKIIGVSPSTLIKWEKEPWIVNPITQANISEAYKLPIDCIDFKPKNLHKN